MSAPQEFRWRTIVEVAVLAAAIYAFLGAPGLDGRSLLSSSPGSRKAETPKPRGKIESLVYPSKDLKCPEHIYDIHIFSTSPLIIYVDGFLSNEEADHLVDIRSVTNDPHPLTLCCQTLTPPSSKDKWQRSTVFNAGEEVTDDKVRKSEKALIDRDATVQCVEQRALAVQGWPESTFVERLWTQRYNVSGHYALHYDWASASKHARRVSTFMVYLDADCEGGGTEFPRLSRPVDERWCEFVECDGREGRDGVTFKARKGAAVFWTNFDADGKGYKETIHAGMPVTKGTKVGLNIWSWYQAGHEVPE